MQSYFTPFILTGKINKNVSFHFESHKLVLMQCQLWKTRGNGGCCLPVWRTICAITLSIESLCQEYCISVGVVVQSMPDSSLWTKTELLLPSSLLQLTKRWMRHNNDKHSTLWIRVNDCITTWQQVYTSKRHHCKLNGLPYTQWYWFYIYYVYEINCCH